MAAGLAVCLSVMLLAWAALVNSTIADGRLSVHQLELDRSVGKEAQFFRQTVERIEELNVALIAAKLANCALEGTLSAGLPVMVFLQDALIKKWELLHQVPWLLKSSLLPLPSLGYKRLPPDPCGPGVLYWSSMPEKFYFRVVEKKLSACARMLKKRRWRLEWCYGR